MNFEFLLYFMKNLHLHVSIHINFYQNQFINECALKIKIKQKEE